MGGGGGLITGGGGYRMVGGSTFLRFHPWPWKQGTCEEQAGWAEWISKGRGDWSGWSQLIVAAARWGMGMALL